MTIYNIIASGEILDTDHLVVLIFERPGSRREGLDHGLIFAHCKVTVVRNKYEMDSQLKNEKVDIVVFNLALTVNNEPSEIEDTNLDALEIIRGHKKTHSGFPYVIGLLPTEFLQNKTLLMSIGIDEIIPLPVSTADIVEGLRRFRKRLSFCDSGVLVPIEEDKTASVWIRD